MQNKITEGGGEDITIIKWRGGLTVMGHTDMRIYADIPVFNNENYQYLMSSPFHSLIDPSHKNLIASSIALVTQHRYR